MGDNQGGGCGAQAAAEGGDVTLRLQMLGSCGISAGLPSPLFNGVNDAPTGVRADCPRPELSADCGREIFIPLNKGVAAAAVDGEPGLSNCLNRSMSICCARATTGDGADNSDGDGESNNLDQLWLPSCPANGWLSGVGLSSEPAMLPELPNPPGMEFNASGCLSEKFQVGNALALVSAGGG